MPGLPTAWLAWNPSNPGASVSLRKGPGCPSLHPAATSPGTISFLCFCCKLHLLMYLSCVIENPKHFYKYSGLFKLLSNFLTRCDFLFVAFLLWWKCTWTVIAIVCKKLKKKKIVSVRDVCKWSLKDNLLKKTREVETTDRFVCAC